MIEPTVIRASALSGYPDCNRRGAARLFRKEIEAAGFTLRSPPRGVGAAIGTAVHNAARMVLDDLARRGALPPASRAIDCAQDTLAGELISEVTYDAATMNRGEAFHQAASMTGAYHRVIAPQVHPILVVPWSWLAGLMVLAALAGMVAAVMPARRAARTSIVAAMADM